MRRKWKGEGKKEKRTEKARVSGLEGKLYNPIKQSERERLAEKG